VPSLKSSLKTTDSTVNGAWTMSPAIVVVPGSTNAPNHA
jgi:hypothetical protein